MEKMMLILDDNRGIYIPQNFAEEFNWDEFAGWTEEQRETLLAGPDHEWYWEAWDEILNNIYHVDKQGKTWTLHQDGAVWMLCAEDMTE